jgi:uncharacterized protein YndB with AHSA1/START domain
MQSTSKIVITVQADVLAPLASVWEKWNQAHHVVNWNHATSDWHSPHAENDFREGGKFLYRMEAKDGSFGFDFCGTYSRIVVGSLVAFVLDDGRRVEVHFSETEIGTQIIEHFEAEETNPIELQTMGWQAILNNFKAYAEQ